MFVFFFKQKTAYEMRISDWSSDVCSSDLRCLAPGGAFVLSVEHPIFTALAGQDWHYGPGGERLHWPVDNYQEQGVRHTGWMADDVIKYPRRFANYLNTLTASGLIRQLVVQRGCESVGLDQGGRQLIT